MSTFYFTEKIFIIFHLSILGSNDASDSKEWVKKEKKNGTLVGKDSTAIPASVKGIWQYKKNSFQQYISIKQATAILSNAFCSTGTTLLALILQDAGV